MNENMQRKGKAVLGTVEVPFDTLVQYRGMLVETANNIEAFVKKQLNPLLGTEKLMNQISADEKEAQEEPDAIYNSEKKGFVCNYEGCSEGRFSSNSLILFQRCSSMKSSFFEFS
jgi:hypothetical protein